jgi:hypothetical protein
MDRTTKLILGVIAVGLWVNAILPMFRPTRTLKASTSFKCSGQLKAKEFGATVANGGGYYVDVTCAE